MELRNPWTFASRLLSNESHGKQRENGYFYLSVAFKRAQLFSFFFSLSFHLLLSLDVSPFSRAVYARQEFLFGLPNVRACTKHTTGSGGLTHRWPTIASNTSNFAHWFHPAWIRGSAFRTDTRGSSHGAYLSDNGQARILKDASTVTTSSMTPNVMYITPRCTSENM